MVTANKRLLNTHVKTMPYPGFPTDMQPQITVTLGLAKGTSIVTESIFESRFKYVDELTQMGAQIKVEGNTAIVTGVPYYTGATSPRRTCGPGPDWFIAALAAEGWSEIDDVVGIESGYEDFPEKLWSLGADIRVLDTDDPDGRKAQGRGLVGVKDGWEK